MTSKWTDEQPSRGKAAVSRTSDGAQLIGIGDQDLLPEILRHLPIGVTVWHLDNPDDPGSLRLVAVNAAAEKILERKADVLLEKHIAEVFPDAIETKRAVLYAQVANTGRLTSVGDMLLELTNSAAEPRLAHLRLFPLRDHHVGMAFEDVTEENRAQIEMTHAQERFAKAFQSGPAAQVIVRLSDSCILDVNEQFEQLFGYSRDEVVGKPSDMHPFYPDELQMQEASRIMTGGNPLREFELTISTKSGTQRDTLVWVEWIDVGGEPCVVGYHLDITDRKRADEELRRLNAELEQRVAERDALLAREHAARAEAEQALRLRDEFLTIASHELKTPLTAFRLLYQLIEQRIRRDPGAPDPDRLLHHLEAGDRQLKRLIRLNNELLDIARLSHGGLVLDREDADLVEIVNEATGEVIAGSDLTPEMIRIVAPDSMIGCWDRLRLGQVLVNLLANAVKFGEHKPITVTVENGKDLARIRVRDEGIGIAPEDQERIFGRVERAVPAEHYGGLGIGLYIAQQIVHAHGGTISVESQLGQGSTFSVELPLV